jgi:phosphate transport system permease protein
MDKNENPEFVSLDTRSTQSRSRYDMIFLVNCIVFASMTVIVLGVLLTSLIYQGWAYLDVHFMTNSPNDDPEKAGIGPAIMGTIWVCMGCAFFSLPIGIGTAIALEEYKPKNRFLLKCHSLIQLNISNLAGVPSVVYGVLGLTAFVNMFGFFGVSKEPYYEFGADRFDQFINREDTVVRAYVDNFESEPTKITDDVQFVLSSGEPVQINVLRDGEPWPEDPELAKFTFEEDLVGDREGDYAWYYVKIPFGSGVLTASLTLMLVILPVIITASQESLRAVPKSLRDGALGMGATQWQVVRLITLPAAIPGIMTGSILAFSRAVGEAAPIVIVAGATSITFAPRNLMDEYSVLPLQIYHWATHSKPGFHDNAAAAILVLLTILLIFNSIAVAVRQFTQKPLS